MTADAALVKAAHAAPCICPDAEGCSPADGCPTHDPLTVVEWLPIDEEADQW